MAEPAKRANEPPKYCPYCSQPDSLSKAVVNVSSEPDAFPQGAYGYACTACLHFFTIEAWEDVPGGLIHFGWDF